MIDIQDAEGSLRGLPSTPEEPEAGQKKRLRFNPKVEISCAPEGLDQFLDNTQAGTLPSTILWWPGMDPTAGKRFPRWLGILELEIQVNPDLPMMLKLMSPPVNGEATEEWKRTRIECAVEVRAKKAYARIAPNAVVLDLRTECYPTDDEQHKLHELLKCEKLIVSFYQPQADLVQQPAGAPPRPGEQTTGDGKVVEMKPRSGRKGRRGAEPPKTGDEDLMFPEAVEHVVSTGRAHVADLQLRLKIHEDRARDMIAAMYSMEIIGPADVDGNHEVKWTMEQVLAAKNDGKDAIPEGGASAEIE